MLKFLGIVYLTGVTGSFILLESQQSSESYNNLRNAINSDIARIVLDIGMIGLDLKQSLSWPWVLLNGQLPRSYRSDQMTEAIFDRCREMGIIN